MPIIPVVEETEAGGIQVQSQNGQKLVRLYLKNKSSWGKSIA
jgi:hypothetical protein